MTDSDLCVVEQCTDISANSVYGTETCMGLE
jgi:hypothetical protein